MPTNTLNETVKSFSDVVKEQGLIVVMCCVLLAYVIWSNYTQQSREDKHVEYQQTINKELMVVVSNCTTAMQSQTTATAANTATVEALRMEIMKK